MDKAKGKWAEKLSGVLWAYRTTKHVPTKETLFLLAYRTEAIIPVYIYMPTLMVEGVVSDHKYTFLCLMLDHSKERCQHAHIRITAYQQTIQTAHYKKVSPGNSKPESWS